MITNPVIGTQGTGVSFLQTLIPIAITWCFIIGAVLFFFMLIIGAIQWIASGGDKGKIEGAKAKISSAIVGLVVLFSVFVIIKLVGTFFNVNLLNLSLPSLNGAIPVATPCVSTATYHCPV